MPQEVELKFELNPEALHQLKDSAWLRKHGGAPKRERLVSVYFDTAKLKLRNKGISLRIRHQGEKLVQTVKSAGPAGGFARQEWECEVTGETPDLSQADETPLAALGNKGSAGRKLAGKLKPIFETDIRRISVPLQDGAVELAIDEGRIKTTGHAEPINEIELEVKQGGSEDMFEIARSLGEKFALRYRVRSKAERGYALSEERGIEAARGRPIQLTTEMTVEDGFRAIGVSCLEQIVRNEEAVIAGRSEGVHQMRVGLRRLRAAISIFKSMLQDRETKDIKAELKWLTGQLGPARDYDVLIREGITPTQQTAPRRKEINNLKSMVESDRSDRFHRSRDAVSGDRFRRLICTTMLWLAGGAWSRNEDALQRSQRQEFLKTFARKVLSQHAKKVRRKIGKIEKLDARRRHKFRIAVKKLRYATEFFGDIFASARDRGRKRYTKVLKELQGVLGDLNDITVSAGIADDVIKDKKGNRATSFAMGMVAGQKFAKKRRLIVAGVQAGAQLKSLSPFWK